ncbi:ATP-grasp domain-containing protein [Micromonospora sp. R77]|uniref:ATP-grasp domain-containing protein n=1 Tax=Micromonospora sp. R77 TaxID=2925836 RepID=UPI001F614390|nr:ATP-grasp domain-containing protein [Micromonospora sp. R77]MCI4066888.1 ATP-grasp domain-containing protein [Micromonospora sp. R77]
MTRPTGVLVDAYSTGNYLPAAFQRRGVDVIHLQSTPELMPSMLPPARDSYRDFLVFDNETTAVKELEKVAPLFVLAGQEPGVPLADRLSELLGLRSNGSALSTARRDKHEMIEVVRAAGLAAAAQTLTDDVETALAWANAGGHWPCVAKPLSSASTDGVFVCRDEADLRRAFPAIIGSKDIFDITNQQVLVQSYLEGTEYIVDTVSADGHAYVCGVWRYDKQLLPNGKPIYNRDVLMDADDPVCGPLIAYTKQVLDALGVRNGPAHSEVIVGPNGPTVVEVGARLNGNMHPGFHDICLGTNQADLIALAYTDTDRFLAEYGDRVYQRRQPALVFNTPTERSGRIVAIDEDAVRRIRELPSVVELTVKRAPGQVIVPTKDLLTSPLRVFMTATDEASLERDYRAVDDIRESVYVLDA